MLFRQNRSAIATRRRLALSACGVSLLALSTSPALAEPGSGGSGATGFYPGSAGSNGAVISGEILDDISGGGGSAGASDDDMLEVSAIYYASAGGSGVNGGGAGGRGGNASYYYGGGGGGGGGGGEGARLGGDDVTVNSPYGISGGNGGSGGNGWSSSGPGSGGGGGDAIDGTGLIAGNGSKLVNLKTITGGFGGHGGTGNGLGHGGNAGRGIAANNLTIDNRGYIWGGVGGNGGDYSNVASRGGAGGHGIEASNSMIVNTGTISGGLGGGGDAGSGGVAIYGDNLVVENAGYLIAGQNGEAGVTGTGGTNEYALVFTGGENRLVLASDTVTNGITSAVYSADAATSTLVLGRAMRGGSTSATFDLSQIGDTAKYRGFDLFEKSGSSVWTLTGSGAHRWKVTGGELRGDTNSLQGELVNNATITFAQDFNGTYAAAMSGTGVLVKDGTGKLTLTGTNTHEGGISIIKGTVSVSADANMGAASGPLRFLSPSYGVLPPTLEVTQSFTSKRAIASFTRAGTISVLEGVTFTMDSSMDAVTDGAILSKEGKGTWALTGDGEYRLGRLTVHQGRLLVDGASLDAGESYDIGDGSPPGVGSALAELFISGGGAVSTKAIFTVPGGGTSRLLVEGAGSRLTTEKIGLGLYEYYDEGKAYLTLANGGRASVSDGLVPIGSHISDAVGVLTIGAEVGDPASPQAASGAGYLDARVITFLNGASRLDFNHTDQDYEFSAALESDSTGDGVLNHFAGVTRLTGDSGNFSGQVNVLGGTLKVENRLGGTIVIDGGKLGGSGQILGPLSVTRGTIAPGNSPGTLSVYNDLTLGSGAVLDFELGSPTGTAGVDSDLIDVAGSLTLDGTLNVSDAGGFGAGLYRLIDYGGALIDNGLEIGLTPGAYTAEDMTVQTAIAGQVNLLVNELSYYLWDGADYAGDGAIAGGAGIWTKTGTNWALDDGAYNGIYDRQVLLIFAGDGGTVTIDNAAGDVSIAGGLQFAADGYELTGDALELDGANTIRVGDGTSAGAGYVATISASLTGTGALTKSDLGTLVLTGANDYSGGTTVRYGTLRAGIGSLGTGGVLIEDNGTLAFDLAEDGEVSTQFTGTGLLAKRGTGVLTLSGDNAAFVGTTEIAGGGLVLTGALGGTLRLDDGAWLGGNGMAGDLAVASGAVIAPGQSIGTLHAGSMAFASGSTYRVELNGSGSVAGVNNDLISLSGEATINGGTLYVTPENGIDNGTTYLPGATYTVLTANGGVTGTFDEVVDDFAFLDFTDSYDATNVYLTSRLSATGFCLDGMSANQCAAGNGVYSLGEGNLFVASLQLSEAEAPAALDQLSGEIHASAATALLEDSRYPREAALARAASASGDGLTLWSKAFGAWGHWAATGNAARLDRSNSGAFLGVDAPVGTSASLGALVGYSDADMTMQARTSSADAESWHVSLYGGAQLGPVTMRAGGSYSWHDLTAERKVAFTGFADALSSAYDARTAQLFGEMAYPVEIAGGSLEPFANLAWVKLDVDSFAEQGGSAALSLRKTEVKRTWSTLGLRGQLRTGSGKGAPFLSLSAGWQHGFGSDLAPAQRSFSGGESFGVSGVPLAQDSALLEAGVNASIRGVGVRMGYTGRLASGFADHAARATVTVRFP